MNVTSRHRTVQTNTQHTGLSKQTVGLSGCRGRVQENLKTGWSEQICAAKWRVPPSDTYRETAMHSKPAAGHGGGSERVERPGAPLVEEGVQHPPRCATRALRSLCTLSSLSSSCPDLSTRSERPPHRHSWVRAPITRSNHGRPTAPPSRTALLAVFRRLSP